MNSIRKIEVKNDDVFLSLTRFGISSENFNNQVLSSTYKEGGQPALDKAIVSMLLDDYCHVELSGDDPSIQPYKKAIEEAEQQHILEFYRNRISERYEVHAAKTAPDEILTKLSLVENLNYRNQQTEEMLSAVVSLIAR